MGESTIQVVLEGNFIDGQVMEFTGQNLKQTITKDCQIIVSQGDSASGQVD
ncbi:hypothetical protein D3C81_2142400 [compost metagenome]